MTVAKKKATKKKPVVEDDTAPENVMSSEFLNDRNVGNPDEEEAVRRRKVVNVTLTLTELAHIHDLMGVSLGSEEDGHVSEQLALLTGRVATEEKLFEKVRQLCAENDIPTDDEAFDYVVGQAGPIKVGVYPVDE